jgi:GDP-L-fucose synthase
MRILVTGATGFLGRTLCPGLENRGHEVVGLGSRDADLTRQGVLDSCAVGRFDRVFHLAAWTQAGDFCLHHPGEQWIINQQINTNVLDWWRRTQPHAKLVCIGSSCVYSPALELSEENYLKGEPEGSLFTYAMTKRMLYAGLLALHRQFGLSFLCLVPSTLCGPDYHDDGRQMHFIFDLTRKIVDAKHGGPPAVLWGDGSQRREVIDIDDFVHCTLELADPTDNELVNIGAGTDHSIRDFARMICERVDFDIERLQFDTTKYVGARSKLLRTAKLRRLLPSFEPKSVEHCVARVVDWYLEKEGLS